MDRDELLAELVDALLDRPGMPAPEGVPAEVWDEACRLALLAYALREFACRYR